MLLDERRAKELFAAAGVNVPPGISVVRGETARPDFPPPYVAKALVLSGGRGKAGAVLTVEDERGLADACERLFDLPVGGEFAPRVLIEPKVRVAHEFYLSFAVSRDRESLVLTARPAGGVDVEAAFGGLSQNVRLPDGPSGSQIRAAFFELCLSPELFEPFRGLVLALFRAVADNGLLLAEINPLALTGDGTLVALDAKAEIDDSRAALEPRIAALFDPAYVSSKELAARSAGFSYVGLSGYVGCLVNGAGLAMATMDALAGAGLAPANFLDLGGAASEARIRQALGLLYSDPQVETVCINLYGGILSCAEVAKSLAAVLGQAGAPKPTVARLAGNGAREGLAILTETKLPGVTLTRDMNEAIAMLGRGGGHGEPARRVGPAQDAAKLPVLAHGCRPTTSAAGRSPLDFGPNTRLLVQGATGKAARLHARLMREYGTNVVAGVTPFKGGQSADGVPVFDSVHQAQLETGIDASIVFVPGAFATEAVLEAADAGVPWIVCITEHIPQLDMLTLMPRLRQTGARLIGPNTPGIIVPGAFKAGIMPVDPFVPGPVAVFSRSGTLTYEACSRLSRAGIGQAVAVGVGGDPFIGLSFTDWMDIVRQDARVKAVLILGEIGGRAEEDAAAYASATNYPKPVAAFVAGITSPPGRRMGHAGAILEEGGGAGRKLAALDSAGIAVCSDLDGLAPTLAGMLA